MDQDLYTIILDFQGGTYVAQVEASDETDAVRRWATQLAAGAIVGRPSASLAKTLIEQLDAGDAPAALEGMREVWCVTAVCGRSMALANIVRSRSARTNRPRG